MFESSRRKCELNVIKLTFCVSVFLSSFPVHGLHNPDCPCLRLSPEKTEVNPVLAMVVVKVSMAARGCQSFVKSCRGCATESRNLLFIRSRAARCQIARLTRPQVFPCATMARCEVTLEQTHEHLVRFSLNIESIVKENISSLGIGKFLQHFNTCLIRS